MKDLQIRFIIVISRYSNTIHWRVFLWYVLCHSGFTFQITVTDQSAWCAEVLIHNNQFQGIAARLKNMRSGVSIKLFLWFMYLSDIDLQLTLLKRRTGDNGLNNRYDPSRTEFYISKIK
jgi:hypothetical protein